jgi:DNA-binding NarL/FixJ family response regulator
VRVQVVDDNETLRVVACLEVEMSDGFELVGEAADGLEAIDVARLQRPDVIILDLEMPRMTGFEALPQLIQIVPDALIVVYTSHDSAAARAKAASLGARAYLVKQSTPVREVLATISRS